MAKYPLLVAAPAYSRKRQNPYIPTVTADIAVVDGDYSNAWQDENICVHFDTDTPVEGTLFVRIVDDALTDLDPEPIVDVDLEEELPLTTASSVLALTWTDAALRLFQEGDFVSLAIVEGPFEPVLRVEGTSTVEQVVLYGSVLPDADILRISTIAATWTWASLSNFPRPHKSFGVR
jgi:hypothetical protein